MRASPSLRFLLSVSCSMLVATAAHAWDPNAGAEDWAPPAQNLGNSRASAPLPKHVVPRRYYTEPSIARTTPAPNVAQAAAPASSITYYRPAPVPTGTIPAPVAYSAPAVQPAPAAPAPMASSSYVPAAPRLATAADYATTQYAPAPAAAPVYTAPQTTYYAPVAPPPR